MNIKRGIAAALIAGVILAPAIVTTAATAAPFGESPIIVGRQACEQQAAQYRAMGYDARCYNTHGDDYYVRYQQKTGTGTGSAG